MEGVTVAVAQNSLQSINAEYDDSSEEGEQEEGTTKTEDDGPMECPLCRQSFTSRFNYTRHVKARSCEKECKVCCKTFRDRHNRKRHEIMHSGKKPFRCTKCSESYYRRDALRKHIVNHHPCKNPNELIQIDLETPESGAVDDGLPVHKVEEVGVNTVNLQNTDSDGEGSSSEIEDRPFKCLECGSTYIWPNNLKRHIGKAHPGRDPDELCEALTSGSKLKPSSSNLKPTVSKLKPSSSNLKPSNSNLKPPSSNLKPSNSNLKPPSSNVDRPFKCMDCRKGFATMKSCKEHIRKDHPDEDSDELIEAPPTLRSERGPPLKKLRSSSRVSTSVKAKVSTSSDEFRPLSPVEIEEEDSEKGPPKLDEEEKFVLPNHGKRASCGGTKQDDEDFEACCEIIDYIESTDDEMDTGDETDTDEDDDDQAALRASLSAYKKSLQTYKCNVREDSVMPLILPYLRRLNREQAKIADNNMVMLEVEGNNENDKVLVEMDKKLLSYFLNPVGDNGNGKSGSKQPNIGVDGAEQKTDKQSIVGTDFGFLEEDSEYLQKLKQLEDKRFGCAFCTKRFRLLQALKAHERIHTGERPYECSVCNKRFNQTTILNNHMRLHTGERPFKCSVCGKRFIQPSSLVAHKRTSHPNLG